MAKRGAVAERSDAVLIERTRKGDSGAYAELWDRHAGAGKVLAARVDTGGQTDAIVGEAFNVALANIRSGAGPTGPFRPYLFAILRQVAATWTRRGDEPRRAADPVNEWEMTEDLTVNAVNNVPTMQAFRTLSPRQQEILWYCEVEEMSAAQVAPLLGVHESNVSILIHRAREALRAAWIVSQPQVTGPDASEHQWVRGHLATYLSDDLKPSAQDRVAAHLRSCTDCALVSDEAGGLPQQLAGVILPVVAGASAGMWYEAWVHAGGVAAPPGTVPPEVMTAASTIMPTAAASTPRATGITSATATVLGATAPGAAAPTSPALARPASSSADAVAAERVGGPSAPSPATGGLDGAVADADGAVSGARGGAGGSSGQVGSGLATGGPGLAAATSASAILAARPGVARTSAVNTMRTVLGLAPTPSAGQPELVLSEPLALDEPDPAKAAPVAGSVRVPDAARAVDAAPAASAIPAAGAARAAGVVRTTSATPAADGARVSSSATPVADAARAADVAPVTDQAAPTLPPGQTAGPGPIDQDFGSKDGTRRFKAAYLAIGMAGILAVEAIVVGLFLVNPSRDNAATPGEGPSVVAAPTDAEQVQPHVDGTPVGPAVGDDASPSLDPGPSAAASASPTPTPSASTTPTPSPSATTTPDARPAASTSPRPPEVNPPTSLALAGIDAGASGLVYPSVVGVAKPGATVTVEGGPNGSVVVQADAAGNWATGPLAGLAPGTTYVMVSSASEAGTVAVSVAQPPSLSFTPTFSGVTVSISGQGGAQVELYADGMAGSWTNITLNGSGRYSAWLRWPVSGGHTLATRYVEDRRAGPMLTQTLSLPGTTPDPAGDGPLVGQ